MSTLLFFLRNRFSAPPLKSLPQSSIAGKTVLVTGASGGLGLEASRHFVRLGAARVILGVRSQAKGDAAKQNILSSLTEADLKGRQPKIDVWLIDLTSFSSVQKFANRVNDELKTLDIAILNAAVSHKLFHPTGDGWDETLEVNFLSTTLLALLLLPKLRESSKTPDWTARLSIVASRGHQYVSDGEAWQEAPDIMKALNEPRDWDRYGTSKLLLIYAINEITKLCTTPDGKCEVVVNYSCPGACKSDLTRNWSTGLLSQTVIFLIRVSICKTTEEGSRTLVLAGGLGEESHGKWIHCDRFEEPGKLVTNEKGQRLQKKVWEEAIEILRPYGINSVIEG
ncbi:hypothetical protein F5884DRAFT_675313 [Xylogone sp. PMI_703]|nr:hypothetical protein F5884DRAFT_675313 [Xylogone sp. PMI_703]